MQKEKPGDRYPLERKVFARFKHHLKKKKAFRRKDGSYIRFDENSLVVIEKENKEPVANRVFGPIPRDLTEKFPQIISLASEVI